MFILFCFFLRGNTGLNSFFYIIFFNCIKLTLTDIYYILQNHWQFKKVMINSYIYWEINIIETN